VLPGLFCLHAIFCSYKLNALLQKLQKAMDLLNEAQAVSVQAMQR
jgi:hypothetical protein